MLFVVFTKDCGGIFTTSPLKWSCCCTEKYWRKKLTEDDNEQYSAEFKTRMTMPLATVRKHFLHSSHFCTNTIAHLYNAVVLVLLFGIILSIPLKKRRAQIAEPKNETTLKGY
jgi:hypothetical protein